MPTAELIGRMIRRLLPAALFLACACCVPTPLAVMLLCQPPCAYADGEISAGAGNVHGGAGIFSVLTEQLQAALGLQCTDDGAAGGRIERVQPNSAASYAGLQPGDQVTEASLDGNELVVTFNRGGKIQTATMMIAAERTVNTVRLDPSRGRPVSQPYSLAVDQSGRNFDPQFANQQARSDRRAFRGRARGARLRGQADEDDEPAVAYVVDQKKIQVLAQYNLELILDSSLSMRRRDCPGGLSRWDWCGYQAEAIGKALAPFVPNGLTITPFAGGYNVYERARSEDIVKIFDAHNFQLGTRLCEPLKERLDKFFKQYRPGSKPLLIAIITDGLPWPQPEPEMVRDELVKASRRIKTPGEVTVAFMQIGGNDPQGRDYLVDLGSNLRKYGAYLQYVHTSTFEELKAEGLAQALVDSVKQWAVAPPSAPIVPSNSDPAAARN